MGDGSAVFYGLLSTSDAFEQFHSTLQQLVALYVDQVGARQSMLGNENGLTTALDVAE
jgi:hypothetical protein